MRAIELRLNDKLFEVVSVDCIRRHSVKEIKTDSKKDFNGGKTCVFIKTGDYNSNEYLAKPNAEILVGKQYSSYRLFTTLEAAQKHQLRRRKNEMGVLLNKFKEARTKYEEFKAKYKSLPASKPE